ncbi:hypothetical protein IFM89_006117 [Coptis chinensis]|uniref:X8 domain-containing protein n=1 Tax=Coptis chinensis TaxID=261450 RepID=A0A835GZ79_9MAGN|nr:hypothetical protein IFM89_006117 [Coptis chinensis]
MASEKPAFSPPLFFLFMLILSSNSGGFLKLVNGDQANNRIYFFWALQKTWCVGKPSSDQAALQANIDYVCGSQVDCSIVLKVGCPCYIPNTVLNHASIAMNLYYQSKGRNKWNCYFNNSGLIVVTDPSKSFLQSSV